MTPSRRGVTGVQAGAGISPLPLSTAGRILGGPLGRTDCADWRTARECRRGRWRAEGCWAAGQGACRATRVVDAGARCVMHDRLAAAGEHLGYLGVGYALLLPVLGAEPI